LSAGTLCSGSVDPQLFSPRNTGSWVYFAKPDDQPVLMHGIDSSNGSGNVRRDGQHSSTGGEEHDDDDEEDTQSTTGRRNYDRPWRSNMKRPGSAPTRRKRTVSRFARQQLEATKKETIARGNSIRPFPDSNVKVTSLADRRKKMKASVRQKPKLRSHKPRRGQAEVRFYDHCCLHTFGDSIRRPNFPTV